MTTWKQQLDRAQKEAKDEAPIIACTLDEAGLAREFCDGFGGTEGKPFTAWTENRVYFPVQYDGAEWVESVPRDPCSEATNHAGG